MHRRNTLLHYHLITVIYRCPLFLSFYCFCRVMCLGCDHKLSRPEMQTLIEYLNPDWSAHSEEMAPDADVQLTPEQIEGFKVRFYECVLYQLLKLVAISILSVLKTQKENMAKWFTRVTQCSQYKGRQIFSYLEVCAHFNSLKPD